MKAQLKQLFDLLDADETLELLHHTMRQIPPSAVNDAIELYTSEMEAMENNYWKDYRDNTKNLPIN